MRPVSSWDKALGALDGKQGITLLLEDWDEGLILMEGLSREEAVKRLRQAQGKYGTRVAWRAFNRQVDVWWNGEGGIVCEGKRGNEVTLLLETDHRRFPGASTFQDASYIRAAVEPVREEGRTVYLRLVDFRTSEGE